MDQTYKILLRRGALANMPLLARGEPAIAFDSRQLYVGDGTSNILITGTKVGDGDYVEITVSDAGLTWTIKDGVITANKLAALTHDRVIGRNTAGDGTPEEVSATQILDWLAGGSAEGDMLRRTTTTWQAFPRSALHNARLISGYPANPTWHADFPVIVQDQKANGTNGGTATAGSWFKRTLNTIVSDQNGICTLSSSVISLPQGVYRVVASAPAYLAGRHQIRLKETTAGDEYYGQNAFAAAAVMTSATLDTVIWNATGYLWELQHRVQLTEATDGQGIACSFGNVEVYATAHFYPQAPV